MTARFEPNEIISLTGAAPRFDLAESVGPDLLLRRLLDGAAFDPPLAYGTAQGDPALRAAIAARHGVEAADVVLTIGAMHALFLAAFVLCGRGEGVVTTAPLFPNALTALKAVGAEIQARRLLFQDGYRLDPDALAAALTPRTRLVLLASPQNPSGVAIPADALRAVLAHMRRICPDAFLLVDETYREAAYGDDPIAPSAVGLGPRVISVGSLSKCHGAPGLRLGWAVTRDADLREQLLLGKFNTVLCCPALDEALALRLMARSEAILAERRALLADNLARVAAWAEAERDLVEWVRPDAGALCCARLRADRFDDAALQRFGGAQRAADMRVAPGAWFQDEPRVFRLGFGLMDGPTLEAALEALSGAMREARA